MSNQVLTNWRPEDPVFWKTNGASVANRNLWISIPALMFAFAVWSLWSVIVVNLNTGGFNFSQNQLFWLAAMPALSGATLRIFYSFMVPIFGGRRWTAFSTVAPHPRDRHRLRLQRSVNRLPDAASWRCYADSAAETSRSSMANISFFFPKERKGSRSGSTPASAISACRRAVHRATRDLRRPCSAARGRRHDVLDGRRGATASGCRMRASSGCRSSWSRHWPRGSA